MIELRTMKKYLNLFENGKKKMGILKNTEKFWESNKFMHNDIENT
jgi:hypothetical protein